MRAMGRIFEVRKHTMFARWNRMAKQFARIAKDITMAVKAGGTDPASNPVLRRTIQNARAVNMRSEEHTSELQSLAYLVCRLLLEKKKINNKNVNNAIEEDTVVFNGNRITGVYLKPRNSVPTVFYALDDRC